jgi:hypothetical protein
MWALRGELFDFVGEMSLVCFPHDCRNCNRHPFCALAMLRCTTQSDADLWGLLAMRTLSLTIAFAVAAPIAATAAVVYAAAPLPADAGQMSSLDRAFGHYGEAIEIQGQAAAALGHALRNR